MNEKKNRPFYSIELISLNKLRWLTEKLSIIRLRRPDLSWLKAPYVEFFEKCTPELHGTYEYALVYDYNAMMSDNKEPVKYLLLAFDGARVVNASDAEKRQFSEEHPGRRCEWVNI